MTYTIDKSKSSPNHSSRQGADISMITLHATVGSASSSLQWLCNPASKVSTHYLIDKAGKIYQLVADSEAAWHAGVSSWFDLDGNDIQHQSIGIELENKNNGLDPYPDVQTTALLELSHDLVKKYAIVPDMVTRHLDIALPKGRKSDPAGFPWAIYKGALYAPDTQIMHAGPFGAIARTDYRAPAPAAAYFAPGTAIPLDTFRQNGYRHAASGIGFIAEGDLI